MKLTEQQIYEKVANQELSLDEAMTLLAQYNAQSMTEAGSPHSMQVSLSESRIDATIPSYNGTSDALQLRLAEYVKNTILPLFPAATEQEISLKMNFMDL